MATTHTRRAALGTLAVAAPALLARSVGRDVRSATIIVVRHAEKDAQPDDPPLSPRGILRADRLARLLGAARLTHAYSTDYRRTRATVAPAARAGGIGVEIYDAHDSATIASTLARLTHASRALVAGHSNTVPAIVGALGGGLEGLDARGFLDESEYDRLVVVTLLAEADGPMRALSTLDLRFSVED
jgi:phosphohistidine phosphatase SixA